jgi:hypothetical protein
MKDVAVCRGARARRVGLFALLAWATALCAACGVAVAQDADVSAARVLDRFDDISIWKAAGSDGVRASVSSAAGGDGSALRLDFDLSGTAGYALAHRPLSLALPDNYEFSFDVRADAPVNDFQFKLIDASGDNVWWFNRSNFAISHAWQHVRVRKRQIDFAWGPAKDHTLTRVDSIEFVVAAGKGGGSGSLYLRNLAFRPLPPAPPSWPAPSATASSQQADGAPGQVFDARLDTAWKSVPAASRVQTFTVDLGTARELGGLVLRWSKGAYASRYDVAISDDGRDWQTVRQVTDGGGGPDALYLPETETRYLRLVLRDGPADHYALAELEIRDLGFAASPNAFFTAVAREWPRGYFPRGFGGEQAYWTLVGTDGGRDTGLLSEDGALEAGKGGFSIEPYVVAGGMVFTWADVDIAHALRDRYLPMPAVTWSHPAWAMRVDAFASGPSDAVQLIARYSLSNRTDKTLPLDLVLAVRPFQVNPPTQTLNTVGGVAPIGDLDWNGESVSVDGAPRVFPLQRPDRVSVAPFDAGPVAEWISANGRPVAHRVHDAFGYASAALHYRVLLPPRGRKNIDVVVPLAGARAAASLRTSGAAAWAGREQNRVAAGWHDKLDRVAIRVPTHAQPLIDTLRTSLAHILVTRDGPMLRPGTRSYARSWIRDGAMMADALLRLGHADVAAQYLQWYAPRQFANGKIPCCVDTRGADPVPENDSNGEFLFLADETPTIGRRPRPYGRASSRPRGTWMS